MSKNPLETKSPMMRWVETRERERENLGIRCLENSRLLYFWRGLKPWFLDSVVNVTNIYSSVGPNKSNTDENQNEAKG